MNKIQRLLLLALVALMGCGAANAQFRFGVKAGMNIDKMHLTGNAVAKKTFSLDNQCGFTGGVMAEAMIPGVGIGFDVSAMYTYLNVENESKATNPGKFSTNFLEIPVNVKYKLTIPLVESIIKPYVFTGPSFSFALDKNTIENFREKRCQTAWNLGLGIELVRRVQIGASYAWNMNGAGTYILDESGVNTIPVEVKAKNNYWTITAAYLF